MTPEEFDASIEVSRRLGESPRARDRRNAAEGLWCLCRRAPEKRDLVRAEMGPLLRKLLRDRDAGVRANAIRTWTECGGSVSEGAIEGFLKDPALGVRWAAVRALGEHGEPRHLDLVLERLSDAREDSAVRSDALMAAARLAPERAHSLAIEHFAEYWSVAICILQSGPWSVQTTEAVIELLRTPGPWNGQLPGLIAKHAPARLPEVLRSAMTSADSWVRSTAASLAPQCPIEDARTILEPLLGDPEPHVRASALEHIRLVDPARAEAEARRVLHDEHAGIRAAAAHVLESVDDPDLVDDLVTLARDPDPMVRANAIAALAKYDDPLVLSELFSALDDEYPPARNTAETILRGEKGPVPALARLPAPPEGEAPWVPVRREIERVHRWAAHVGRELLGRPVRVVQYRQGLGRTARRSARDAIEIEVSDTPVTSGHPHGVEIMKALALHEIGHHLCDIPATGFRSTQGVARAEGLADIFAFLLDERLDRTLRARRPGWGIYFDRLVSYAFSQSLYEIPLEAYARFLDRPFDDVRADIERGALPGRLVPERPGEHRMVVLASKDLFRLPGAVPPLMAFSWALRCGFDARQHPNPRVAEAIAAVPRDLPRLDHAQVLSVARRIGDLIGRGESIRKDLDALRELARRHEAFRRAFRRWLERMAKLARNLPSLRSEEPGTGRPGTCSDPRAGRGLNLQGESEFAPLSKEVTLPFDAARHMQIVARIRTHIRRLRAYLSMLGRRMIDEPGSRRGSRVDVARARWAVLRRDPNLLVFTREMIEPDLYLGLLIDRSGSMTGDKIDVARAFGVLVAESAKGLPGIEGHVSAFDGDTFYPLGDFRRNAIASLEADDGNNDAGGLDRAAKLALRSRKRRKLIIVVSDGQPTECTFEALRNLVERLTRDHGIVCVQAAVDRIEEVAFPHFVDLTQCPFDEAVRRFGSLIVRLTAAWR